jgi:RNA polymerase sigma-70 factor (ECF subfamily)
VCRFAQYVARNWKNLSFVSSHGTGLETRKDASVNSDYTITGTAPLNLDLVRRAQRGDSDAFAALFHAHKTRIYSLCLRMTNNAAEAEDFTQDAFLQVFRKIGTFRGDSAFSTWLHRIAVNTVLMCLRKKSLRQVSLDEPYGGADGATMPRQYGTKDDRLAGCVDRVALASAIKGLPPGYRTMFLLHEVQGYEHREIAEMLGCSVGNSKSQLHKAKLRLRESLAYSRGGRPTAIPVDESSNKHSKPLLDAGHSPISQDVAMQKVSNLPQLIPRSA